MFQVPCFAPAGTSAAPASNNNTSGENHPGFLVDTEDNFDVDLLAEYLLDDSLAGLDKPSEDTNVDFSIGPQPPASSFVSPAQSEDGSFPPVAEATTNSQFNNQAQAIHHPGSALTGPPTLVTSVPVSPTSATADPSSIVVHQHEHLNKRRRVDNNINNNGASMLGKPLPDLTSKIPVPEIVCQQQQQQQQMIPVSGLQHQHQHQPQPQPQQQQQQQGRGRKKTQAQIDRRRERNRILARRTRLRKKFFFESLQKEVIELQRQNSALKELVKERFAADESKEVLEGCKAAENLPQAVVEACGEHVAELDQQDFNLVQNIQSSQHSFVITDPCLQDNPIVFASDAFLELTGFTREAVLGRNCRFLQGTETNQEKLEEIRKAMSQGEDVTVTIVNYMADGTAFWNKLFIAALRDCENQIVNYIGVIVKVSNPPENDPESGKLLPGEQVDPEKEAGVSSADEASPVEVMDVVVSANVATTQGC